MNYIHSDNFGLLHEAFERGEDVDRSWVKAMIEYHMTYPKAPDRGITSPYHRVILVADDGNDHYIVKTDSDQYYFVAMTVMPTVNKCSFLCFSDCASYTEALTEFGNMSMTDNEEF